MIKKRGQPQRTYEKTLKTFLIQSIKIKSRFPRDCPGGAMKTTLLCCHKY